MSENGSPFVEAQGEVETGFDFPFEFDAPKWKDFSQEKYQFKRRLLEKHLKGIPSILEENS